MKLTFESSLHDSIEAFLYWFNYFGQLQFSSPILFQDLVLVCFSFTARACYIHSYEAHVLKNVGRSLQDEKTLRLIFMTGGCFVGIDID